MSGAHALVAGRSVRDVLLHLDKGYRFIAFPPSAPATADAIAIITFRIVSQIDFLAITFTPPSLTL